MSLIGTKFKNFNIWGRGACRGSGPGPGCLQNWSWLCVRVPAAACSLFPMETARKRAAGCR